MSRIRLDTIASAVARLDLPHELDVQDEIPAEPGTVCVVRVVRCGAQGWLQDALGRRAELREGDFLAVVLSGRRSATGYAGDLPKRVRVGDVLHLLSSGGLVGRCTSINPDLGPPPTVVLSGAVLRADGSGVVSLRDHALPLVDTLPPCPPIIAFAGTAEGVGKTTAVDAVARYLTRVHDLRVAVVKLCGDAGAGELAAFQERGASTLDVSDAGVPTTAGIDPLPVVRSVLAAMAAESPDCILAELDGGLIGAYGVRAVLEDAGVREAVSAWVMCVTDPVSAWGAHRLMTELGLDIDVYTGPATDNDVGTRFIRGLVDGTCAINSRKGDAFARAVCERAGLLAPEEEQLTEDELLALPDDVDRSLSK